MGKSPASCFRIITCGGGDGGADEPTAKDTGDLNSYENKRGWSFRKKSGRHRGLNTSTVSETPAAATRTRETLESALLKSPSPDNNNVSEKPYAVQSTDDKSQLPVTYVAQPTEEKAQVPVPEDVQPAGDKTELSDARAVEQVDDRTELPVPVESRGTETEVDASETEKETESQVNAKGDDGGDATVIVKDSGSEVDIASKFDTQEPETDDVIVIRKESVEEVSDDEMDESVIIFIQAAIRGFLARRKILKHRKAVKLQAAIRGHLVRRQAMGSLRCVQAIVKMQALVRARQSMQHSSSRASAILDETEKLSKTNASSASVEKLLQNKFARQLMESSPKSKPINIKCDPTKPSSAWNWLERWMFVSSPVKTSEPDLSTGEQQSEKTEVITCPDEVPSHDHLETEIETGKNLLSDEANKIEVHNVEISEAEKASDFVAVEAGSLAEETESANEQPKNSLKRKASNPSFIAAQSKFEELSSSTGSNKPVVLSYKDVVLGESKIDRSSSEADDAETQKELSNTEDVAQAQLDGGFEPVTELSVPSTLEKASMNSETEAAESNDEAKFSEKGTFETNEAEVTNIEVKDLDEKRLDEAKDEAVVDSFVSETRQKPVMSTPDSNKKKHEEPFSPGVASPMTIPESQATPASQASSVKAKKDKTQKSGSSLKRKVSKKMTTSSPNHESGGGVEQESGKDHKSGRRRNSFDQELRDSSGGKSSVPRFMQPTESARAKVQEQNSPRSSPDVHERDASSLKKRHSLPGANANGKQSTSPRIQRSTSQATKERKWQR